MENKNEKLAKKSLIYFIGSLSSKILNFILVPIYAYTISSSDLGNYDYIITLANIIIPVIYIVLWDGILKFSLSQKAEEKKITTTSSLFILTINIVLMPILYVIFKYFYNIGVDSIYVIGIFIVYGLNTIWQYYARALKKEKLYVISSIIATIINLILNIITICILKMGFVGLTISYIISNLISIGIIELNVKVLLRLNLKDFDKKLLYQMIKFSAPLVLNTISAWLLSGMSKVIIISKLGSEANGIYTFASKFSIIVTLIGSVINMAFIEESIISSKSESVDKDFLKTVEFIFEKFLSFLIVCVPVINIFYLFITNTEYYDSRIYFSFLLIYGLFSIMSTNIGTIFHVVNKTKYAFFTTLLGAIVFIIISILGIEKYGLMCVIVAQIIGSFIMFFSRYIFAEKNTKNKFKWKKIILFIIVYIIITIICYKSDLLINAIILFITFIFLCYDNRKIIYNVYQRGVDKFWKN